MYALISQITRLLSAPRLAVQSDGVAERLMQSAEARAGLDPQHAQELRSAALAYLRVVR